MLSARRWIHPVLLSAAVLLVGAGGPKPPLEFPQGVASGEVTHSSAILWTRANQETAIKVEGPSPARRSARTSSPRSGPPGWPTSS